MAHEPEKMVTVLTGERLNEAREHMAAINRLCREQCSEAGEGVHFCDLPEDLRWDAHVLACSLLDSTFWVKQDPRYPGYYSCTEIETGTTAWGFSAWDAVKNYHEGEHMPPKELTS